MKRFKTVIIGCGNIAGGYDSNFARGDWPLSHAGAFVAHEGFDLIACCEPDPEKRQAFQEKWSVPRAVAQPEELEAHQLSIDVVSICSPTILHSQHLQTVFDWSPRLIFCEKPITPNIQESEHWVKIYEGAGIKFVVNHTRRWAPDICTLKEEFEQQKWGKIRSVAGFYNKGILNNGGHLVDLIQYLLGPMRVIASGSEVYDFCPDDPSIPALLETHQGIPITFHIGHAQDYAAFEVEFVTECGVLRMEAGGMRWSNRAVIDNPDFAGYRTLSTPCVEDGRYCEAMSDAVDNIYNALTTEVDLLSTGTTALQAQRICHEIRQATQTNPYFEKAHS